MAEEKRLKRVPLGVLYNDKDIAQHLTGLKQVIEDEQVLPSSCNQASSQVKESVLTSQLTQLSISSKMSCSLCETFFKSRDQQVNHYKEELHQFNLKQKLSGKRPYTQNTYLHRDDFITDSSDSDVNSESDSDSSDSEKKVLDRENMAMFINNQGELVSLYRCVLDNHMETSTPDKLLFLPQQLTWMVILVGGGHFAAAVFKRGEVLVHKTIHRYVVRAKQGQSQSGKDNKHGGRKPKSAGANLRRYNEAALEQDIVALLESWSGHLESSDRIFYHAVSKNKSLIMGKGKPLAKEDSRLRRLPFPTFKPTYKEVFRVYQMLATIYLEDGSKFKQLSSVNKIQQLPRTSTKQAVPSNQS